MKYRFIRFPEGKEKALTVSYDDASRHDLRLIEIADRHGLKVTLNVNSGAVAPERHNENRLSVDELKAMQAAGHEIAVHGATHIALGKASAVDGIRDILDCRRELEQYFGGIIRGMAYADSGITHLTAGVTLSEIKSYLKALGIAYARTLGGDNDKFHLPEDFYEWMPTAHHDNPHLFDYLDRFLNTPMPAYCASRSPRLFYLWGHSHEFVRGDNWDRFEDFCQRAGGREDVWYATNIEICEYIEAYRQLRFNVANTLVYNPTTVKLWMEVDGKLLCVGPGETKEI